MFRTMLENAAMFGLDDSYTGLLRHVITPILNRYGVPEKDRGYLMTFHLGGLMAIVSEWLKGNCVDPVENIISVIQACIKRK